MRVLPLLSALALLTVPAMSAAATAPAVKVTDAWSRPAAASGNGAGYMVLTNTGGKTETLTAVQSNAAAKVEIHQSLIAGGVMSMKRIDNGVAIAPGQSVKFAPGGYHVMLLGLTRALKSGDSVPATLVFASGAQVAATFKVGSGPASGAPMNHMDHMGSMEGMKH